jgi:hypothetical protein
MSSYRYVVFPRGRQPAAAEVRELQTFAAALAGRFAWGTCRDDDRLTIAFDRDSFDHVAKIDPGFESLIARWQARGCELLEHLGFVKDPAALKPASEPRGSSRRSGAHATVPIHNEVPLPAKELAAHEAIARSRLGVVHTLERYDLLQRFASVFPYVLMALAAITLIAAGLYTRHRLLNADREPRQETIERMVDDSLQEPVQSEHK